MTLAEPSVWVVMGSHWQGAPQPRPLSSGTDYFSVSNDNGRGAMLGFLMEASYSKGLYPLFSGKEENCETMTAHSCGHVQLWKQLLPYSVR